MIFRFSTLELYKIAWFPTFSPKCLYPFFSNGSCLKSASVFLVTEFYFSETSETYAKKNQQIRSKKKNLTTFFQKNLVGPINLNRKLLYVIYNNFAPFFSKSFIPFVSRIRILLDTTFWYRCKIPRLLPLYKSCYIIRTFFEATINSCQLSEPCSIHDA